MDLCFFVATSIDRPDPAPAPVPGAPHTSWMTTALPGKVGQRFAAVGIYRYPPVI